MSVDEDLFARINNAVLDLQAAKFQSYDRPLKTLARLLRHPDFAGANERLTSGCDLDAFLSSQNRHGGLVGSDRLQWPDDPEKALGITLLLIEKFAANPNSMMTFGHEFFNSGSKIMDNVNAVTSQVIIPFVRDYRAYVATNRRSLSPVLAVVTTNKVFVVHGHDEAAREAVARFLESLGLEPVILHEQPNSGQTIIEKFETHASTVGFAVILLTRDDVLSAGGSSSAERARQNVIYELGFFVGRIGRGRVCLLRKGAVDMPSDLAGVVYTDLDSGGGWRLKLAKELKAAGFRLDANKLVG